MLCIQFGMFLALRLGAKCKRISVRTDTVARVGFRIHCEKSDSGVKSVDRLIQASL